jgi:hypothetical protein
MRTDDHLDPQLTRGKRIIYGLLLPMLVAPVPVSIIFAIGRTSGESRPGGDPMRGMVELFTAAAATTVALTLGTLINLVVANISDPESRKQAFMRGLGVFLGVAALLRALPE